jgi:hypothetical protein
MGSPCKRRVWDELSRVAVTEAARVQPFAGPVFLSAPNCVAPFEQELLVFVRIINDQTFKLRVAATELPIHEIEKDIVKFEDSANS